MSLNKKYFIIVVVIFCVSGFICSTAYSKDIFTINDFSLARPELRCFKGIHYQPAQLHLKFFDFDAGLMLYTESGKIKRPRPLMLFFAFNQPIRKFAGKRYYLNHSRIVKPIIASKDNLTVVVRNSISEDTLKFLNEQDKLIFVHSGNVLTNVKKLPTQIGIVIRLPVWIWSNGSWSINGDSGKFSRNSNSNALANKLPVAIKANSLLTLNLPDDNGKPNSSGRIIIKFLNRYDGMFYLNQSGNLGMFFDLFFVKNIKDKIDRQQFIDLNADKCEIRFEGKIVPDIWQTFSLSKREYEALKSLQLHPHPSFGRKGNMKLIEKLLPYQCMDKSNCFYGAIFKSSGTSDANYWLDVPLQTRNFVYNLARQWYLPDQPNNRFYHSVEAFKRITAALDYLSTATTPFGQYGDVRLRGWTITPFLWGIMPVAESIYYVQDKVTPERKQNWLAMLTHLYRAAEKHLKRDIDNHTGDGANLMTYAQQIFDLALVMNDDDGKLLAHKGVHCAIEPEFNPKYGIRRDFSYQQGNLFDVGYYQWLINTLASYVSIAKDTRWALTSEEQNWLKKICQSFIWLYDNGLLNTMTSHPKNRLSLKPFPEVIAEKIKPQVPAIATIALQSNQWRKLKTDLEKEKFVSGIDFKLPMSMHWFSLARYFIKRTPQYYVSLWWNCKAQVRDFRCNGNYNAKIPVGAMYVRWLDEPREIAIPSDNIHYSGIIYLKDMLDIKDWASGFANYKGSMLLNPILIGNYTVLAGKLSIRSRQHPNKKIDCIKTIFFNDEQVISFDTMLSNNNWKNVIFQPVVLRKYINLSQKITVVEKDKEQKNFDLANSNNFKRFSTSNEFAMNCLTTSFRFIPDNLVGIIKLSQKPLDGSQRYSLYKPARILEVQFVPKSKANATLITEWCHNVNTKSDAKKAKSHNNVKYLFSANAHLIANNDKLTGVIYRPGNVSTHLKVNQRGQHYILSLNGFSRIFVVFCPPASKLDVKVVADVPVTVSKHQRYFIIQSKIKSDKSKNLHITK